MSVKVSWRENRKRWQVEYYVGGVRKRPLFLERPEADGFARKVRLGLALEDREAITIEAAGQKYFHSESVRKNPKSRTNDRRYINLLFHFMTYERGIERLPTIQLEDMEAFREWLPKQTEFDDKPMKMGPSTVNRCLRVLRRFFVKHIHWKSITENPCTHLELLQVADRPRPVMTSAQYLATLELAEPYMKPVLQFMYLTASPASVVSRLKWSDVSFQARTYTTERRKGSKAQIKLTEFGMTDEVFALLVLVRNQWNGVEGSVFRDSNGVPLLADRITREGNAARVLAGARGVTLYGLRHALATDLTTANVATEIVRQAMGHASIVTTQRYANKVGLRTVAGAIESVRGANVVAESESEQRQLGAGFGG